MLKVLLYCISKKEKGATEAISNRYIKLCKGLGVRLEITNVFSGRIQQLQHIEEIKKMYSRLLLPHLSEGFCIALDVCGERMDSMQFANMLENKNMVVFFVGGAYGLQEDFLQRCHKVISLSPLTFSHNVAKIVLEEQIYRALSLIKNHPYHK